MVRRRGIVASFRCAGAGFAHMWATERNMKIHFAAATAVIWLAYVLSVEVWEWAALVLAMAAVISLESLNTAIERVGDVVPGDLVSKIAKDTAAAAVLTMSGGAVVVGVIVFAPKVSGLGTAAASSVAASPIQFSLLTLFSVVTMVFLLSSLKRGVR